ncbi:MAG: urocanate hydratase, partial [Cyclobacteriaceae bacterium]
MTSFKNEICIGIPSKLPAPSPIDSSVDHAPRRKEVLALDEKKLAIRNALRYFPPSWHEELAAEFLDELKLYGRIYMYRFRPSYKMYARPVSEYPGKSDTARAIMLMIQNNLDPAVAQFPHELITYGGNGAVFQNWAQYLLTMKYLSEITDQQTLHMYSGHPMGLFPSSRNAPRVVVTNGLMIPNYSKPSDYDKYNALGVTQYGQMTAGSYMYIGPQGIVHGTTITLMNAFRKVGKPAKGNLFVTAGLGGMSGAQPKAANIVGCVSVCAEVNAVAAKKRHEQGWIDVLIDDIQELVTHVQHSLSRKEAKSYAYIGNIVEVWEAFYAHGLPITLGSDQTSLHNPFAGGYYPVSLSFDASKKMMSENPDQFKNEVQDSLVRHASIINKHVERGMYFF